MCVKGGIMRKLLGILAGLLLLTAGPGQGAADDVVLAMARRNNENAFYQQLLTVSLEKAGHVLTITDLGQMPQVRRKDLLDKGFIDIDMYIQTSKRDERWTPVEFDILDGLIGHRILLIPKGKAADYAGVETLDDFLALGKVGGFGKDWYDIDVWKANDLPYVVSLTEWGTLFKVVASQKRGVDYFSRGFTEIVDEAREHPDLEIEPRLMLIYEREHYYYLSKKAARWKPVLEKALRSFKASGEYESFVQKHWAEDFAVLQPSRRTKLFLKSP